MSFLIKASVVCSFSVFARKKLYLGDFALVLISYRDSEFWAKIIFCVFSCGLFWLWLLCVVFGLAVVFERLGIRVRFLCEVLRGLLFRRFLRRLWVFRFRRSVR